MQNCQHDWYWRLCWDEEGWVCSQCNALAGLDFDGFSPYLDRTRTRDKIKRIIGVLGLNGFIDDEHWNEGQEKRVEATVIFCQSTGFYDQLSIVKFVLSLERPDSAEEYKQKSFEIIRGK